MMMRTSSPPHETSDRVSFVLVVLFWSNSWLDGTAEAPDWLTVCVCVVCCSSAFHRVRVFMENMIQFANAQNPFPLSYRERERHKKCRGRKNERKKERQEQELNAIQTPAHSPKSTLFRLPDLYRLYLVFKYNIEHINTSEAIERLFSDATDHQN